MTERSPGPWRWPDGGPPCVKDADDKLVFGCNVFAVPTASNARLIAAAPEMLALLRDVATEVLPHEYGDLAERAQALLDRIDKE